MKNTDQLLFQMPSYLLGLMFLHKIQNIHFWQEYYNFNKPKFYSLLLSLLPYLCTQVLLPSSPGKTPILITTVFLPIPCLHLCNWMWLRQKYLTNYANRSLFSCFIYIHIYIYFIMLYSSYILRQGNLLCRPALTNMVSASHLWVLITWNVAGGTEESNFKFYLI